MMTWLDWLQIAGLFFALCGVSFAALIAFIWLLSEPIGGGPERIVDVENRGNTKIRMPDGSIK
jgi:hypothetical protein